MSITTVNWADDRWRVRQGETVVDNLVVVPIMPTIVDVLPIARMIIAVGGGGGNVVGDGDNDGGGGDTCLRNCSDADSCPVCGRWRAGWRQQFRGNRHAVKIGSPIKLRPETLVFRQIHGISPWCGLWRNGLTFVVRRVQAEHQPHSCCCRSFTKMRCST